MALQAAYEQFLATPNPVFLSSEKASFSYVPTLTTVHEVEPIIKHLESQNKTVVRKKAQKVISAIESHDALAVEVDTTLEFISGGGAYLPGLDNFVVDKVAIFPTTHIVVFDDQRKIKQVRISWDQGALLKQVDVIGASGRNWPITDGKDQIRLVAGASVEKVQDNSHERGRDTDQVTVTDRTMSPGKKHMADPYSSLASTGFAPPTKEEQRISSSTPVTRRMSAKPPPRDFGELFVGDNENAPKGARPVSPQKESQTPAPKGAGSKKFQPSRLFDLDTQDETLNKNVPTGARPVSPQKENQTPAPKGAGSKNFQPSRLFDLDPQDETPHKNHKTDPRQYSHFDIGNGDDEEAAEPQKSNQAGKPLPTRSAKHLSQFEFADFSTPAKLVPKVRAQDVRHHGWSDDEGDLATSPGKQPHITHPRRDAEQHFTMQDEATPIADKTRPTSSHRDQDLALYQNHIYNEEQEAEDRANESKRPLSTVTNVSNTNVNNRNKDFGAHWEMNDGSPSTGDNNENKQAPHNNASQMQHVKMMDSNWGNYDQSPEQTKTENKKPANRRQHHAQEDRHWGFGDDADIIQEKKSHGRGGSAAGGQKNFWDF